MSHIFDALQKSAAEGSGIEIPSALLAADLLQAADRKAAAAQAAVAVSEPPGQNGSDDAENSETVSEFQTVADFETAPITQATELLQADVSLANESRIDQFSQFQSLKVLVPPQSRMVCVTDKESLAAEKFRFLGVRLRQLRQKGPLKKVLITSTIPQEGKTMVAANLACALARRNQHKTLLLEGDLRRPALAQMFGLGKIPGISEWLQGERGPMTSIYHLEGAGLWLLPAGSAPRNPLELMQSGRLSALMDQLTTWFDWIVIDSPPVLPLGDTSIWMRLADGILLVTRQGATEKEQLQRGLEAIEPAKLLGALLNCCANTAHSDYYHHYSSSADSQPTDDSKK
jgi:capsular exopolysaccharide synthesis family protein